MQSKITKELSHIHKFGQIYKFNVVLQNGQSFDVEIRTWSISQACQAIKKQVENLYKIPLEQMDLL